MTWMQFLTGCLVTFRLSLLISKEDGPAFIFKKIREWTKRKLPRESSIDDGIRCQWCTSVWMGNLVAVYFWWRGDIEMADTFAYSLAFSAGAICINQTFTKS